MLLQSLGAVKERFNWCVHAYYLMDIHYHFLIETLDGNLSKGMRQLNDVYPQTTNRRHGRVGHLFQRRYKAFLIQKENYLLQVARYIILNPIGAQLVRSAYAWPWSSYRATAGLTTEPTWLTTEAVLSWFGGDRVKAVAAYQQFLQEGKGQPAIWESMENQILLGNDAFVDRMQGWIERLKPPLQEIPR